MAMAGSVAAFTAFPLAGYAQTDSLALEEVTVTARKKEESLQDVAIAVTAISAQLQNASVKNIQDLNDSTCLELFRQLQPKQYQYKDQVKNTNKPAKRESVKIDK